MPSYAVFPEVALFSSDLTQRAIYPLSDATKKPLEYGLIRDTFKTLFALFSSSVSGMVLNSLRFAKA